VKIYLSGPMTGLPDCNYPRFNEVAGILRNHGYDVYNPAEYPFDGDPKDFPIREAFAEYSKEICLNCDALLLLEGWESSKGANAELHLAKVCGLILDEWKDGMDIPPPPNRG